MKKAIALILSNIALFVSSSFAQSAKEGVVSYSISVEDMPADKKEASLIPVTAVHYSKGALTRLDIRNGIGTTSLISDRSTRKSVVVDGKVVTSLSDSAMLQYLNFEIKEANRTEEKKSIAGTNCTRFRLNVYHPNNDSFDETNAWSAETLVLSTSPEITFEGVRGFPMEFDLFKEGRRLHFVATKIEIKNVEPSLFVMPKATEIKQMANPEMKESKMEIK
ncbi:MAG: hypothetical protein ACKO1U_09945 [Bacteroidota bacterium]